MKRAPYSLEALREYRRRKEQAKAKPTVTLAEIPPDAPMEEGIVLGCWNGEAFVSWEKWIASLPSEHLHASPEGSAPAPQVAPSGPRKPRKPHLVAASLFDPQEDYD